MTRVTTHRSSGPEFEIDSLTLEALFGKRKEHDLREPQCVYFYFWFLVDSGTGEHMIDFQNYSLEPGSLLLVQAGQVHAFRSEGQLEGNIVLFSQEFLTSAIGSIRGLGEVVTLILKAGPVLHFREPSFRRAQVLMNDLVADIRGEHVFPQQAISTAFASFLCKLSNFPEVRVKRGELESDPPLLSQFRAMLEEHFIHQRQTAFYARRLGVSARTLDRHLVKSVGKTGKALVMERVLLEAKRMLTRLRQPIKVVADRLEFSDVGNFTRFFKAQSGVSPQDFRGTLRTCEGDCNKV